MVHVVNLILIDVSNDKKNVSQVATVHNYGAFVRIPGSKNQGLIHRSQVSKVPVDDVSEVLQRGDKVWCKVINITASMSSFYEKLPFVTCTNSYILFRMLRRLGINIHFTHQLSVNIIFVLLLFQVIVQER